MKPLSFKLLIACMIIFTGCATYQISTQSLSQQMVNAGTEGKGYISADGVKGNDLKTITCIDKKGIEHTLNITNRTGIRITRTDHSRITFYANTILIKDSSILGSKTHFF